LDPDGDPQAWAGAGLLHEVGVETLPRSGRVYRPSFGSATLLAVRPLGPEARPWRLVAGRTYSADSLPFDPPGALPADRYRWSLADDASSAGSGSRAIEADSGPVLIVDGPVAVAGVAPGRSFARLALALIGLALLGLAVLRGVGLALRAEEAPGPVPLRRGGVALALLAGIGCWAQAATGSGAATTALLGGVALALLGLWGRTPRHESPLPVPQAVAAALALVGVAWGFQALIRKAIDLGGELVASPEAFCLRLALWAGAFGLLLLASREGVAEARVRSDSWPWIAGGLLATAAAFHDRPLLGLPLLVAGFAVAALWAQPRRLLRSPGIFATAVLLAALASAVAWETGYRLVLRDSLENRLLARMAPPSPAELDRVRGDLGAYFEARDLSTLTPLNDLDLQRQDLAYVLWRRSPLARNNALSALVVQPDEGLASSFTFGLALTEDGETAELPRELGGLPLWDDLAIEGRTVLRHRGARWGEVHFWLRPRPGFGLESRPRAEQIAAALLRRVTAAGGRIEGLPREALYGLYASSGRALLTPWEEAPPLAPQLIAEEPAEALVETPLGPSRAYPVRGPDGWEVLFLPRLGPVEGLDRVGTHAVPVLTLLTLGALVLLLLALPRPAFRDLLRRTLRSYSKRLLIAYTVFALVPLPLLNITLVAAVEKRLWRQQRTAGEAVLVSAQRYMGEYLLSLPIGISVDRSVFDDGLRWLSAVVRHDLNVYWGPSESEIASSRPELFTAGLLPKRIPGEVYARLALGGFNLSSRNHRVAGTPYVELYAPLREPGVSPGGERLFLSMPLLAQQELAAEQLADLRRQSLLFSTALLVLLVAVSTRLARGFSAPITDIVEGTRRIAGGATSLEMTPSDPELAALVEAVDEMASRVAEGRRRLLQEKRVVERIVEHITSGVVSLDRKDRVLMRNRVAAELLGVGVGEPLVDALARSERLEPVAAALHGAVARRGGAVTVRLAGEGGQEREWSLVRVEVPGSGEPSSLLVVEDATEVLRGQRLQAWAEMARIIAHEIKNPLTPIRLSAEHMRQVHAVDPDHFDTVFDRCNDNILRQVDELQQIASEFSTYSSLLRIDPKPGDLAKAVGELVESYLAAPPPGVEVRFVGPGQAVPARFDARLLGRAIRNLLENAVRASSGGGSVEVRVETEGDVARVVVADRGPGVAPDLLGRIFDPYFSTHDTGTGLGLPIARRVAEEHGGSISARNRSGGGLEVVITLPRSHADSGTVNADSEVPT
ncbi:MAG: hypothetical protein KDD11_02450, partial [Acidobacteria bacterium]|nr:hypothetical protein [Acidobacteriota bacterium]